MLHGRFSGHGAPANWIVLDIVRLQDGRLAEHWDVIEDEVTRAASVSGLPMFGDRFPEDECDGHPSVKRGNSHIDEPE
jgi:hypothetical protein